MKHAKCLLLILAVISIVRLAAAQAQMPQSAITQKGITIAASYSATKEGKGDITVYIRNDSKTPKLRQAFGLDLGFWINRAHDHTLTPIRDADPTARTIMDKLLPNRIRLYHLVLSRLEITQLSGKPVAISTTIVDPSTNARTEIATLPQVLISK